MRISYFRINIFILILIFCILTLLVKSHPYFILDLSITRLIQQFKEPWFLNIMKLISFFGDIFMGIMMTLAVTFLVSFVSSKKDGLTIFVSAIGITIIAFLIKILVARPRPDPNLITQVGKYLNNDSFPSGHVLHFLGLYGILFFLIYIKLKKGILKGLLLGFLFSLIILVGVSRIYLGAHWFSDVLGSYLIGTVWIFIIIHFYKKELTKRS